MAIVVKNVKIINMKNPLTEISFSRTKFNRLHVPPLSSTMNECTEDHIPPLVTNDSKRIKTKVNIDNRGPRIR